MRGGRRQRRRVFPLGQALPDFQCICGRGRVRLPERAGDERRPAPARLAHTRRQTGGIAVEGEMAPGGEMTEQIPCQIGQHGDIGLQPAPRRIIIERQTEPARGWRGGARREGEGEQLEQVVAGRLPQPEPAKRRPRVDQQRRWHRPQAKRGLLGGQKQHFAIGRKYRGPAMPSHDGRRVGNRQSGR
jgi:hypothetical protein